MLIGNYVLIKNHNNNNDRNSPFGKWTTKQIHSTKSLLFPRYKISLIKSLRYPAIAT